MIDAETKAAVVMEVAMDTRARLVGASAAVVTANIWITTCGGERSEACVVD